MSTMLGDIRYCNISFNMSRSGDDQPNNSQRGGGDDQDKQGSHLMSCCFESHLTDKKTTKFGFGKTL